MAVWPSDDVLAALETLPRPEMPGVRWTSHDQWHVTLRFLGDADVDEAAAALALARAARTEAALHARTRRLGRGVICIDVSGLDEIAAAVTDATAALGKRPEHRSFRGHLTLARVDGRSKPPLADVPELRWAVATFALVRSHLGGGPARYETVATWPLQP